MTSLPDLSQLNHAQKDALILALWAQVQALTAQLTLWTLLDSQIKELQARLSLNSQNSSNPPSSDGLNKPAPKSLRKAGQRPTGGQKGRPITQSPLQAQGGFAGRLRKSSACGRQKKTPHRLSGAGPGGFRTP